jgi:hypothetical protein
MEKNSPLLSTTFINRFEGNCGTFGKETKNPSIVNDNEPICLRKIKYQIYNNNHGVDVSMIIII